MSLTKLTKNLNFLPQMKTQILHFYQIDIFLLYKLMNITLLGIDHIVLPIAFLFNLTRVLTSYEHFKHFSSVLETDEPI